jgi:hypothetical protein
VREDCPVHRANSEIARGRPFPGCAGDRQDFRFIFDRGDIAPELGKDEAWLATRRAGADSDRGRGNREFTGIATRPRLTQASRVDDLSSHHANARAAHAHR